jgi:phage baseplate assembly protein W
MTISTTNKDFNVNTDYSAIYNAIQNIFNWLPGERILNPSFGNTIYKFVSELINDVNSKNIVVAIQTMFQWDPRVQVTTIDVVPKPDQKEYDVSITYSIPILQETQEVSFIVRPVLSS